MIAIDAHTHTVASGHFTHDTLRHVALAAKKRGLHALGTTEHAPGMIGTTTESYFLALPLSDRMRYGIRLFFGTELNILDRTGRVDLPDRILSGLDYAIASLHTPCCTPMDAAGNTDALIGAMQNPQISVIGHPNDVHFPVDLERLVRAASQTHTILELNEASLVPGGYRGDNRESARKMLQLCRTCHVPVLLSSDSHGASGVGLVTHAEELLQQTDFPDELVVNRTVEGFCRHLKRPPVEI